MTRSQLGQLAFFTAVAKSLDSSSLNLRERPAQKGQSKISPGLAVSEISNAFPHSGHLTVFIRATVPKDAEVFPDQNPQLLHHPRQ